MGFRTYMINNYLEVEEKKQLEAFGFDEGVELIYNQLMSDNPCMVARFGSIELDTIVRYSAIKNRSNFATSFFWNFVGWNSKRKFLLKNNAGFFSNSISNIERFCELMISSMPKLDILASWVKGENLLLQHFEQAKRVSLLAIEPYNSTHPWTRAFENKKVLVVHPFSESIEKQYFKRSLLFDNKQVLPQFELITIKAVQSIAGQEVQFKDWFEALDYMKKQIKEIDFDIALIGCGAYGFPLAAYAKDLGKKAVHMGGAIQILFGIKGKRWGDSPLYNEYWVRPSQNETPVNAASVESGCYW